MGNFDEHTWGIPLSAISQGALADPFSRVGTDKPDMTGSFGPEEIEEGLQRGPVVTGGGPHQTASVVVDDDHQILVAAPIRDLIDPDPTQPVEGIPGGSSIGHDATGDGANGSPRHAHQRDDRGLGRVSDQPPHLIIERTRVAGTVP